MNADQIGPYDFHEGHSNYNLTMRDRLTMFGTIGTVPMWCPLWSMESVWAKFQGRFSPGVMNRIYGHFTKSSTISQIRMMVPIKPLREELASWSQFSGKNGISNYNKIFPSWPVAEDTLYSARWFKEVPDRKPEDPVILFFHGGGFALKLAGPHVEWLANFAKDTDKARVSILVLDYTVSPYARYPEQLGEAVRCYADLAQTCDRIIIMGDSCGGNLGLGLIQCLPVPPKDLLNNVPEKIDVMPWGMLLLSPWCCIVNYDSGSYVENGKVDLLGTHNLAEMLALFCDDKHLDDPRVNPIKASPEVWKYKLPPRTACTWGASEVLRDSIRDWMSIVPKTVERFEQPGGLHDATIQSYKTEATKFILKSLLNWLDHPKDDAKGGVSNSTNGGKRNWRNSWRGSWRASLRPGALGGRQNKE